MFEKHYKKLIIVLIIVIAATVTSYLYVKKHPAQNSYIPKVLIIYKSGTENYLDTFQNYNQSYILNTKVTAVTEKQLPSEALSSYDVVYPDVTLISDSNIIFPYLNSYVSQGGFLFLENEWFNIFPNSFTGIKSLIDTTNLQDVSCPQVSYNLLELQKTVKSFVDNFATYRKNDLSKAKYNTMALSTAKSILDVNNKSLLSLNTYNNGVVLMCSSFIPNKNYITGFDLKSKGNQPYFDYAFATINYMLRNEFLAYAVKEKRGFVLKKVYGPYGRPAMAWQNHYEGLSSIQNKEMIGWIDILKGYNQIPSFSLIRAPFDWGKWESDITVHINKGSSSAPIFIGESENSYYSSGERLSGANDYISFGEYPEYKNLADPITLPNRTYPAIVDYDNDGDNDIIAGSDKGLLYTLINNGTRNNPSFADKQELMLSDGSSAGVGSYASPTTHDINKDGLFDLIVGDGDGYINVFINTGTLGNPAFSKPYKLDNIKAAGVSAPSFGDIDNDGSDELLVGNSLGTVELYKLTSNKYPKQGEIINKDGYPQLDKFSAPFVYDYNNDGQNDVLLGDNSGTIKLFTNKNGMFTFDKMIEGQTLNPKGNHSLVGGHNSVPIICDWNNDGAFDLLVGQLEFGLSYDITDKFFKYKNELKEIIKYANDFKIPVNIHFFTHKFRSDQQEQTELLLQKKAFKEYNLPWEGLGVDQHTWKINNDYLQTFDNEILSGLWYNFGFNPPNEPDNPRDGKEFMWSMPFMLSDSTSTREFLLSSPSPNLFNYSNVYNSLAALNMPITYFEHIEYGYNNPQKIEDLKFMAQFLNKVRYNNEYNFMLESQMAKSFLATIFSKANIIFNKNVIAITADNSKVPNLADEYKVTLGLKFERGEKYKDINISTSSPIYYERDGNIYFGLTGKTKVILNQKSNDSFHIVRSNVPLKIHSLFGTTKIDLLSPGMQEIKLYSKDKLDIKGDNIRLQKEGDYYTITHYGDSTGITIKRLK